MKKLIVLFSIITSFGYSQNFNGAWKAADTTKQLQQDFIWQNPHGESFVFYAKKNKDVAGFKDGKLTFVNDSLNTIKITLTTLFYEIKNQAEFRKQYEQLQSLYSALNNILYNVKEDGTIIDKKEFDKAVKAYKELINKKWKI